MFGKKFQEADAPQHTTAAKAWPTAPAPVIEATAANLTAMLAPQPQSPRLAEEPVVRSEAYQSIRAHVFATMNVSAIVLKSKDQIRGDLQDIVSDFIRDEQLRVTGIEQKHILDELLNDMFGLGPIEPLLRDDSVTDILVNGPDQVYVERAGRLVLTDLKFRDLAHVTNVARRIAASIGRRVDESSPMVDARLADGSRVNVVLPPLALKGACISIRKFSAQEITLDQMVAQGNLSPKMADLLKLATACRLNVVIAGGTGSGKTTLLNAMSRHIDGSERIITIEDAAELRLQQPHVVSLETRPQNAEGLGEVGQFDLVRNALRMRPDRIILGETRGAEAFDVLQAMNTGHDGSMTTIHANSPRDAITRLESMVLMSKANLPLFSVRHQIASAVHLLVQIERMSDGKRRVTRISEITGMEGDVLLIQELFRFEQRNAVGNAMVEGDFVSSGLRPAFTPRAAVRGLEAAVLETIR